LSKRQSHRTVKHPKEPGELPFKLAEFWTLDYANTSVRPRPHRQVVIFFGIPYYLIPTYQDNRPTHQAALP